MAIRPVDLQLAYLAGPQNAAVVSNSEHAPQASQQAAAASFAAEVTKREESVDQPQKAEGGKVRGRGDRDNSQRNLYQRRRQAQTPDQEEAPSEPLSVAGDGEPHLIDFTA